ncbi:MAG TPA: four helix bundle protein [Candidatus Kryptobacter bacterium]|nr:four helix bundle protein [Candidatus Kryptobacter bacterium]
MSEERTRNFRELIVWQKAHKMTLDIYRATASFPKEETYGITSQLRKAASSVPANIAEGCGRNSEAEFARFMQIAAGSASEVEYHLLLAHDLNFIEPISYTQLDSDVNEVKKMLNVFLQRLRSKS